MSRNFAGGVALPAPAAAPISTAKFTLDSPGHGAAKSSLEVLNAALGELRALGAKPLLKQAVNALNGGDAQQGMTLALRALEQDEQSGLGWYLLAIAKEMSGDFAGSIQCYEAALSLLPDHTEITNNLGRLAYRLGQPEIAEQLFRHFLSHFPNHPEGANNLACVLRDQGRADEAIDLLKATLSLHPDQAVVWNTLGTVMAEQGDMPNAKLFFDETLRLDPSFAKARYNRGNMNLALGDISQALEDCETALSQTKSESERIMMRLARSTILINLGRIREGWEEYEARLDPQFSDVTRFMIDRPQWAPGDDLAGKALLLIGEQGLGDEILFANIVPDILQDLGSTGRLAIAVEPRLIPLFQRALPTATVGAHATFMLEGRTARATPFLEGDLSSIDLWAPLASPLRHYRAQVADFPQTAGYLKPDPARVVHWRALLASLSDKPKVGLLWKSGMQTSGRHRFFSPFEQWSAILTTPGVTFVNLQYGDCDAEIEWARRELGVAIWTPPGIDLKQDLDDLAALTCAIDLNLGFSNATLNIAGACGAPTWLISAPGAWPRLGTDHYPWYPQARVFQPTAFADWAPLMSQVAGALAEFTR